MPKVQEVLYSNLQNEELQSKIVDKVDRIRAHFENKDKIIPVVLCTIRIQMQTKDNSWYDLVETVICFDQEKPINNCIGNVNERCYEWINKKLANYKHIINKNNVLHVYQRDGKKSKLISTDKVNEVTVWFEA